MSFFMKFWIIPCHTRYNSNKFRVVNGNIGALHASLKRAQSNFEYAASTLSLAYISQKQNFIEEWFKNEPTQVLESIRHTHFFLVNLKCWLYFDNFFGGGGDGAGIGVDDIRWCGHGLRSRIVRGYGYFGICHDCKRLRAPNVPPRIPFNWRATIFYRDFRAQYLSVRQTGATLCTRECHARVLDSWQRLAPCCACCVGCYVLFSHVCVDAVQKQNRLADLRVGLVLD